MWPTPGPTTERTGKTCVNQIISDTKCIGLSLTICDKSNTNNAGRSNLKCKIPNQNKCNKNLIQQRDIHEQQFLIFILFFSKKTISIQNFDRF